jgi:hypothetical protein
LEASLLKSLNFRCCLGGGCTTIARAGISFFSLFWLCISVMF